MNVTSIVVYHDFSTFSDTDTGFAILKSDFIITIVISHATSQYVIYYSLATI